MFVVDGEIYLSVEVEERWLVYSNTDWGSPGGRIAFCFEDPGEVVSVLLYCKNVGISVLAIPIGTAHQAAERLAEKAGCQYLVYGEVRNAIKIHNHEGANEASLLQMSSGTTGDPKVLMRPWSDVDKEVQSTLTQLPENQERVSIVACPVTHSYGFISGVLVGIARGCVVEIVTSANPKSVLRCLMKNPQHILYASPVYLEILCQFTPASVQFDAVMTSGVSMSQRSFAKVRQKFKHLYQQYGCSEVGCISLSKDVTAPNTVGVPLSHLVVSAGMSAGHAEEVIVTRADGQRVDTGDLAYFEDGQLHYVARKDDMINCAGINVYPSSVESVMLDHPEVVDAVVYGVEDKIAGQKVYAKWVCAPSGALNEYVLREWLADRLMVHQVPHVFEQVEKIERAANGKISRRALAAQQN